MQAYCAWMWAFINTSAIFFLTSKILYLLPSSSVSQYRKKTEEAELLLSFSVGCFLSWQGAKQRYPWKELLVEGKRSWVFWTPFSDSQSYLASVWYVCTTIVCAGKSFRRMCIPSLVQIVNILCKAAESSTSRHLLAKTPLHAQFPSTVSAHWLQALIDCLTLNPKTQRLIDLIEICWVPAAFQTIFLKGATVSNLINMNSINWSWWEHFVSSKDCSHAG